MKVLFALDIRTYTHTLPSRNHNDLKIVLPLSPPLPMSGLTVHSPTINSRISFPKSKAGK